VTNDTHPDAERVQIELLRKAGPRRRSIIASRLTNQSRWRARRGILRAHPDLNEADRRLLFIEVHYGRDLADRVRQALSRRDG
jgi:hypothetical protein